LWLPFGFICGEIGHCGDQVEVDHLLPIHQAQLLSYLKLSKCSVGLLINFNVKVLKDGIRRVVNHFPDSAVSAVE
jgi:hypothetical protein